MAGTPKRREERQRLLDGLEDFADILATGASDKQALAEFGISVGVLYKLEQENKDVAERLTRARRAGAAGMMSETLDIADELTKHAAADPVRVATARIQVRQRLAGLRDREQFGDKPAQTNVQVNISGLHLTALKAATQGTPMLEAEYVEVVNEPLPITLNDLL